jgi:phosphatidylserine/phosphatidylglycerophosphate/cardiolipin synthase-like enzyme
MSFPISWQVYFSPTDNICTVLDGLISRAKISILLQIYLLTDPTLVNSLLSAHTRGVKVKVILDSRTRKFSSSKARFLASKGMMVYVDAKHAAMHSKFMILDDFHVVVGSYNYTASANTKNAENILILSDRQLASSYTKNWHEHRKHSYRLYAKV